MIRKLLISSITILVAVFGCFFLLCLGLKFPLDLFFNLAFGWALYVSQTLPRVRLNGLDLAASTVCLVAFSLGLHTFLRWLFAQVSAAGNVEESTPRPWPIRWTGAILGLIVLMFIAGLAAVGISHQTAWLLTSPESITEGGIRQAVARSQSMSNLKQMTIALLNYQESTGALPPAALWSDDGQPLLSWRVLILPYLDEENLFKKFRLHEPWDSPHNLRLLPQMPKSYRSLSKRERIEPYTTHYQVFVGRGAAFEGKRGLRLPADFPDGTANTLLFVEAAQAVPWTKPEDLPYYPGQPLPALGDLMPDSFFVTMGDGSIRRIERDIEERKLRAMVTRNGGEPPPE